MPVRFSSWMFRSSKYLRHVSKSVILHLLRRDYVKKMESLVRVDGSIGEGGGQVMRIALTFSVLFEFPIEIYNIRKGREKPGLAAQHLKGVELLKELCNAELTGAEIGSTSFTFRPGKLRSDITSFIADTQTAGCITLLAQIALPCVHFMPNQHPIELIFKGGTNVPMGPPVEYFIEVFQPMLTRFGGNCRTKIVRRGYYPKGGGELRLYIKPVQKLKSVELLDPGKPADIKGGSYAVGNIPPHVPLKIVTAAEETIKNTLSQNDIKVPPMYISHEKRHVNGEFGHAVGINLICKTSSGCIFGASGLERKREKNSPGSEAAIELVSPILTKSCVDVYAQDQMIILMALAEGKSRIMLGDQELTSHTNTAIQIIEMMLKDKGVKFNLTRVNSDSGPHILECTGCGLSNRLVIENDLQKSDNEN